MTDPISQEAWVNWILEQPADQWLTLMESGMKVQRNYGPVITGIVQWQAWIFQSLHRRLQRLEKRVLGNQPARGSKSVERTKDD